MTNYPLVQKTPHIYIYILKTKRSFFKETNQLKKNAPSYFLFNCHFQALDTS